MTSNDSDIAMAKNRITGETRSVSISLEHLEAVTMDQEYDICSGECECQIEQDGVCPDGWPSLSLVAGIICLMLVILIGCEPSQTYRATPRQKTDQEEAQEAIDLWRQRALGGEYGEEAQDWAAGS